MVKILEEVGLSFDDVLLVPRRSSIGSRFNGDIDLSVELVPGIKMKYGAISANMDTVSELDMTNVMYELGCLGIPHRFLPPSDQIEMLDEVKGPKILCIGVGDLEFARFVEIEKKLKIDVVLIDIAHGHSDAMITQITNIRDTYGNVPIIAGNVATYSGAMDLLNAGANSIKCGVGPGSLCSTRVQTGNGVPQVTAIIECRKAIDEFCETNKLKFRPTLIGDGGIRSGGDIIKAYAAGSDAVMVGNLFAATSEAPGALVKDRSGLQKKYRGMASRDAQENWKGYATSVEGEMIYLPYKGTVVDVFHDLLAGMVSGMSYQNAHNIEELQENAVFRKQTQAGYFESQPHALLKRL